MNKLIALSIVIMLIFSSCSTLKETQLYSSRGNFSVNKHHFFARQFDFYFFAHKRRIVKSHESIANNSGIKGGKMELINLRTTVKSSSISNSKLRRVSTEKCNSGISLLMTKSIVDGGRDVNAQIPMDNNVGKIIVANSNSEIKAISLEKERIEPLKSPSPLGKHDDISGLPAGAQVILILLMIFSIVLLLIYH